jgi:hypothetical protein
MLQSPISSVFQPPKFLQDRLRPLKIHRAHDVVRQIDQPDIRPSPHHPYRADAKAVHAIGNVREDVFNAGTNPRLPSIAPHLSFRQRLIAIGLLMDLAPHSPLLQTTLDLR